jgi:hypothetical protein
LEESINVKIPYTASVKERENNLIIITNEANILKFSLDIIERKGTE